MFTEKLQIQVRGVECSLMPLSCKLRGAAGAQHCWKSATYLQPSFQESNYGTLALVSLHRSVPDVDMGQSGVIRHLHMAHLKVRTG